MNHRPILAALAATHAAYWPVRPVPARDPAVDRGRRSAHVRAQRTRLRDLHRRIDHVIESNLSEFCLFWQVIAHTGRSVSRLVYVRYRTVCR